MTERDLTKLMLKCLGALKETKDWDIRITSTSYAEGNVNVPGDKKIVYHLIYYNGWESRKIDIDYYLSILDQVNTPEEQIALGQNIIARIYVQIKA